MALYPTPNHVPSTKTTVEESIGLSAKAKKGIAAISAVAMLGAGGAFMLNRGGEEAPTENPVATQPEADPVNVEQPAAEQPADEPVEQPANPEAVSEESFTVTRANGETITLNPITEGSPEEIFDDFSRLFSCYITTGDETCASFLVDDETKLSAYEDTRKIYEEAKTLEPDAYATMFSSSDTELAYNNENNSYSLNVRKGYILRSSGEEMFNVSTETDWRSSLEEVNADIVFTKDSDGILRLTSYNNLD